MNWEEMVNSGLLVTLIGMVAWCIKLVGNHTVHRLDAIEEKLDSLDSRLTKWITK